MMIQFRQLATLRVTHAYSGGVARDVGLAIPEETAAGLRRGRMVAKVSDGVLYLLYEADDTGQRLVSAAGVTLRVGLTLESPAFRNVTDPASLPAAGIAFWRNRTTATALDAMEPRELVGHIFSHALSRADRPVTVTVEDDSARVLRSETVTAAQGLSTVSLDLTGADPGPLTVREAYLAGPAHLQNYLLHPELARENLIGVVDLTIPESFYTSPSPPAFEVAFVARSETLCYYLVVANYSDADFNRLIVNDAGFGDDGRPRIEFDKVPAGSFGPDELPTSVLGGDPSSQFVLFKSQALVTRQEPARRKIQLARNGDILIEHLPQPGAEQVDANLVIHVSKAR
jgi:hypothetical protein